jgi:transposase
VVILDQAGFHPQAGLHEVPERIHVLPLPPYSPELNPVELTGDVIEGRIANALWSILEELEEAWGEELWPIYQSAERVRRLISHPWLAEQINASGPQNNAVTN